jgi:hypothetical protein
VKKSRIPWQWIILAFVAAAVILSAIIYSVDRHPIVDGEPTWSAPALASTTPTIPLSVSGNATAWWTNIPTEPSLGTPTPTASASPEPAP